MLQIPEKLATVIGDTSAKAFEKQLGIKSSGELLEHYPRRYASRGELTSFDSLPVGELVSVVGEVESVNVRRMRGRQGSIFEVTLSDGSVSLSLAFFNQTWRQKELVPGARGLFSGRVGVFSGKLQLAHPEYELFEDIEDGKAKAWAELPIPIYKSSGTLTTWKIQKAISIVLDSVEIPELLPAKLIGDQQQIPLREAVRKIHRPASKVDYLEAQASLRFHEAMALQLHLSHQRAIHDSASSETRVPGELLDKFDTMLTFQLTSGQKAVSEDILKDLASGKPMHRLLQGEVGSGKTLVALRSILAVAESGGQSALLAPTEVLANQHFRILQESLGDQLSKKLGVSLLTGQMTQQSRKKVLLDLASGKCLLVVGTHALISDLVSFYDLGLVVIDEQHRFGVAQREKLRQKANRATHVLTMTATPIPRTLAITVFGELDVSTLTELPGGRKEIKSYVVEVSKPSLVARVWERVKEEVSSGRQVFVVCPRIDAKQVEDAGLVEELELDDGPEPASAVEVYEALRVNKSLQGLRIGLMHGRLDSEEKTEVMNQFTQGKIDVLVSTTVIEVGVNVPNASVMVVLDADRFGISQLHQLRGRVGRGEHPGLCFLVSAAEQGSLAMQRLEAVASTNDGFKLSEIDLELRGEGDVLGTIQSGGKSSLKLLRVIKDAELIEQASGIAKELYDAGLTPGLKKLLEIQDAEALKQS